MADTQPHADPPEPGDQPPGTALNRAAGSDRDGNVLDGNSLAATAFDETALSAKGSETAAPPRSDSVFRFRRAVLRGMAVTLPPVLTIVILVWAFTTIRQYVLTPVEAGTRELIVWQIAEVRSEPPGAESRLPRLTFDGLPYRRLAPAAGMTTAEYIPEEVYLWLRAAQPDEGLPSTGFQAYRLYVQGKYLRPEVVIPIFVCLFLLFLYLLGKLLAVGAWDALERGIQRLPFVRSVYRSVKKVTNFVFVENPQKYKRVVAVEYPRKGIWSIGLVTSDGVSEVNAAAREPTVTVLLPGSPTPITGYCVMIPRRETHDVQLTIDQALQFYLSCGVSVPPQQMSGANSGGIEPARV